jgi:hypothetical protein
MGPAHSSLTDVLLLLACLRSFASASKRTHPKEFALGSVESSTPKTASWDEAGWFGRYMGLDPTDAPLLLRDIRSEDICALTLD